jgi:molybdate transport system substrate-binding protein
MTDDLPGDKVKKTAEIKVLSPDSLKHAMTELVPQFEKSSGHKVIVEHGTVGALAGRIQKGEAADVAIATRQQIENLEERGRIVEGSAVNIARQGIGLFVRKGAPKPEALSVETFRRTLLAARSIGHADPDRGGAISNYVAGLLGRLDIAADIKPKIRLFPPSDYGLIAKGEVEIGLGGIGEIMAAPGIELVGPLPETIQNYTLFAAGIAASSKEPKAGGAFIRFLVSPVTAAVFKAKSFEPV